MHSRKSLTNLQIVSRLIWWGLIAFVGALFGSNTALDGVAKDCQRQTFFSVSGVRFECMEWKKDTIYWDPTPSPMPPPH